MVFFSFFSRFDFTWHHDQFPPYVSSTDATKSIDDLSYKMIYEGRNVATSAGEGRPNYWRQHVRAGDITQPGPARKPRLPLASARTGRRHHAARPSAKAAPAPRPAGARGSPVPEGVQLEVLAGAGVPACYAYARPMHSEKSFIIAARPPIRIPPCLSARGAGISPIVTARRAFPSGAGGAGGLPRACIADGLKNRSALRSFIEGAHCLYCNFKSNLKQPQEMERSTPYACHDWRHVDNDGRVGDGGAWWRMVVCGGWWWCVWAIITSMFSC